MTGPVPAAAAPPPPPSRAATFRRRLMRRIERGLAIIGLTLIVWLLCFDLSEVASPSMSPTLKGDAVQGGDWVLAEKLTYRFRNPRRWEVAGFTMDEGIPVMKRVVGLPGESVGIADGKVVLDGKPLEAPPSLSFLHYYAFGNTLQGHLTACGEGFFVLGDDSQDSEDSRYTGPVPAAKFRLRPWLILWPLSRFGFVQP